MRLSCVLLPLALGALAFGSLEAQSPTPMLMQPVAPGSLKPTPAPTVIPSDSSVEMQNMVQLLQTMQATNADTIKKQLAAIETLDALQKAAEEIKIFSKRG